MDTKGHCSMEIGGEISKLAWKIHDPAKMNEYNLMKN